MNPRLVKRNLFVGITLVVSFLIVASPVHAVDDGARAYWKARDGTHVISTQYLFLDLQASGSKMFEPGQFIFPNSDVEANLFAATYAHHFTLFDRRPSTIGFTILGGSADLDVNTTLVPAPFLPTGVARGATLTQSASGYGDPIVQFDVNLFGTPPLKSTVDLLNYEPSWTLDVSTMAALPIGNYDAGSLINIGQNRFYGRLGFPMKYHFGAFAPGQASSFELTPSVWIFGENNDFLGQELKNDPLWQVEAHLTHDFTRSFFGSLDLFYARGFQSEVNGASVGSELEVGNLGFTFNFNISDNTSLRAGFSSNVFGDGDLDNSMLRIQFVYGWHRLMENLKKLRGQKH